MNDVASSEISVAYENDTVRAAKESDLLYVIELSKKENHSLGFIPKMAYESAITGIKKGKRWSDVCNDMLFVCESNGDLVGFCLASFGNPFVKERVGKVAQICIQEDARKIYRGRLLLESVLSHGIKVGCHDFKCGCADDLESNLFWKAMDWKHLYQRRGISHQNTWLQTSDRLVNIYAYYDPRQMRLWEDGQSTSE